MKMLDLIEKLARGEAPPPPVATLIGFSLASIEPGRAVIEFEATERHANPMGTLHGGILADLGAAVLVPLGRRGTATAPPPGQRARVFWMGALGFAAAFALSHWGLVVSSATNAALLIVVEPLTLVALGPLLLGERLTRREAAGAAVAVAGALLVVLNGVPGLTLEILPRWRGDLLLVLSG